MTGFRRLVLAVAAITLAFYFLPVSCGPEPAKKKEILLVFVHGAAASPGKFDWLAERLEKAGWDKQYRFSYSCRSKFIEDICEDLRAFIREDVRPGKGDRIAFIGHSLGGVISRFLVERMGEGDSTEAVILIGSPNQGTPSADALREMYRPDYLEVAQYDGLPLNSGQKFIIDRLITALRNQLGEKSILQLCTDSPLLERLNGGPLPSGVEYLVAAGNTDGGTFITVYQLLSRLRIRLGYPLPVPHDGLVSVRDVVIPERLGETETIIIRANHMGLLRHSDVSSAIIRFLENLEIE